MISDFFVRRKAHGSGTEEYYVSFEAGEEQIRELSADNYFRSTEAGEEWSGVGAVAVGGAGAGAVGGARKGA